MVCCVLESKAPGFGAVIGNTSGAIAIGTYDGMSSLGKGRRALRC